MTESEVHSQVTSQLINEVGKTVYSKVRAQVSDMHSKLLPLRAQVESVLIHTEDTIELGLEGEIYEGDIP